MIGPNGHVHSFTRVPIRSLGEDLETKTMRLVLNDEFGYTVPIRTSQAIVAVACSEVA